MADPINHTFWYLSRASGLSAYVMLCVNIALGLALSWSLLERFAMKMVRSGQWPGPALPAGPARSVRPVAEHLPSAQGPG